MSNIRSATDLLPKCPDCGNHEQWDRVPSGWVRRCGHGGVVTTHSYSLDSIEREFKMQAPKAIRTNWMWTNDLETRRAYLIVGRLWSVANFETTDVWVNPDEKAIYARSSGYVRTFRLIEEPLPAVDKTEGERNAQASNPA